VKRIQFVKRLGEDAAWKIIQTFGDVEDFLAGWDEQIDLILRDDFFQRREKRPRRLPRGWDDETGFDRRRRLTQMSAQTLRHENGVTRAMKSAGEFKRNGSASAGDEDVCHVIYRQEREEREENLLNLCALCVLRGSKS
jgi:hypothetical protein